MTTAPGQTGFCPHQGRPCQDVIPCQLPTEPTAFVAYPFAIQAWADELARELAEHTGVRALLPDSPRTGIIFCKICSRIRAATAILSEVTTLNRNVIFEHGFALAQGRKGVLLREKRNATISQLDVLRDIERCEYDNRSEIYTYINRMHAEDNAAFQVAFTDTGEPKILGDVDLSGVRMVPGRVCFLKAEQPPTDAIRRIEKVLRAHKDFKLVDPMEYSTNRLVGYMRELKEADRIVGHFVHDKTRNHEQHNALTALLLGLALGFGREILILQETPCEKPMIDLGGVLREYTHEREAERIVKEQLGKWQVSFEEEARKAKRVELTIRTQQAALSLGKPAAENDPLLETCFLRTHFYDWAAQGQKFLIVGQKGAGKTALFQTVGKALPNTASERILSIAPTDLQMHGLQELATQYREAHLDLVLRAMWRMNLLLEIAQVLLTDPAPGVAAEAAFRNLDQFVADIKIPEGYDFASRFQHLCETQIARTDTTVTQRELMLRARLPELEALVKEMTRRVRVRMLFDNLDRGWNVDHHVAVRSIAALVHECSSLRYSLADAYNPTVFLRRDILEVLKRYTDEPDKWESGEITWSADELRQMLELRMRAALAEGGQQLEEIAWQAILPEYVGEESGPTYLLNRTFLLPRDAIDVLQRVVDHAAGGTKLPAQPDQVRRALVDFSLDRIINWKREFAPVYPGIEGVLDALQSVFQAAPSARVGVVAESLPSDAAFLAGHQTDEGRLKVLYETGAVCLVAADGALLAEPNLSFERAVAQAAKEPHSYRVPRFRVLPRVFPRVLVGNEPVTALHPVFRPAFDLDREPVRFQA